MDASAWVGLAGAFVAVFAATIAFWQAKIADSQAKSARQQAALAEEQAKYAEKQVALAEKIYELELARQVGEDPPVFEATLKSLRHISRRYSEYTVSLTQIGGSEPVSAKVRLSGLSTRGLEMADNEAYTPMVINKAFNVPVLWNADRRPERFMGDVEIVLAIECKDTSGRGRRWPEVRRTVDKRS